MNALDSVSGRGRMNKILIPLQENSPNKWLFETKMFSFLIAAFSFLVKTFFSVENRWLFSGNNILD